MAGAPKGTRKDRPGLLARLGRTKKPQILATAKGVVLERAGKERKGLRIELNRNELRFARLLRSTCLVRIDEIVAGEATEDGFDLRLVNGEEVRAHIPDAQARSAVTEALFVRRGEIVVRTVVDRLVHAVLALEGGDVSTARERLEEVVSNEAFNEAPALLLAAASMRCGDRRRAVTCLAFLPPDHLPHELLVLVATLRLTSAERRLLTVRLGADDSTAGHMGAFAAIIEFRHGRRAGRGRLGWQTLLERLLALGDFPLFIEGAALLLSSLEPDERPLAASWFAEKGASIQALRCSGSAARPGECDPVAEVQKYARAATAQERLEAWCAFSAVGGGGAETVLFRAREDWAGVVDSTSRASLDPELVYLCPSDIDAIAHVVGWVRIAFDDEREAERAWGYLRTGRASEARSIVGRDPEAWLARIAAVRDLRDSCVWLASLVAAELLVRAREVEGAFRAIDVAWQDALASRTNAVDPYVVFASSLGGLYRALARSDASACRTHAAVLASAPGMCWVVSVCESVLPRLFEPEQLLPPASTRLRALEFASWARRAFGADGHGSPELATRIDDLEDAARRKRLRVVVTGETSAGKSTFLNALLGAEVLFATQEEATAVPTFVIHGRAWGAEARGHDGIVIARLERDAADEELKRFVLRYTAVSSPDARHVRELWLECPVKTIAPSIEYVDTPGTNAEASRESIARRAIEGANACVFVIDGRNALKRREVEYVNRVAAVGARTLFVVNKMDLVGTADDLDCDDDPAQAVLARVRSELRERLVGVTPQVFAVSSAPVRQSRSKGARSDASSGSGIAEVRVALRDQLVRHREDLLASLAVRIGRTITTEALSRATSATAGLEVEIARLRRGLPEDSSAFAEVVRGIIDTSWDAARAKYVEVMDPAIQSALDGACAQLEWLTPSGTPASVQWFINHCVPDVFEKHLRAVEAARSGAWRDAARMVLDEANKFVASLYEDLLFQANYDGSRLIDSATPLPLDCVPVGIDPANYRDVFGWLERAFGSESAETLQGILNDVLSALQTQHERVCTALNRDIDSASEDQPPPMLTSILDAVEAERVRFDNVVRKRLRKLEASLQRVTGEAESHWKTAYEASDWLRVFASSGVSGR